MCYSYYVLEIDMETVTVSPKYQVVIPRVVREKMQIRPGERLEVISFDDRIELVPIRPMHEMKGFLKGLDPTFERDEDERA
jgi:AbrB family looped-hinge helix DNA binding protein